MQVGSVLGQCTQGGRVVANPAHRKQAETYWNLPVGRINPKPGYHTVQLTAAFPAPHFGPQ